MPGRKYDADSGIVDFDECGLSDETPPDDVSGNSDSPRPSVGSDRSSLDRSNNATSVGRDQILINGNVYNDTNVRENEEEREIRILLVGKTGSGKSSTGNTFCGVTGKDKIFRTGGLASSVTKECKEGTTTEGEYTFVVVDTPGFCDPNADPTNIEDEVKQAVYITSPGPHAVLYVTKAGRSSTDDETTIKIVKRIFGQGVVKHMFVILTCKDELDDDDVSLTEYLDSTNGLKRLVKECNQRIFAVNNKCDDTTKSLFRTNLLKAIQDHLHKTKSAYFSTAAFLEDVPRYSEKEFKMKVKEEVETQRTILQDKYDKRLKENEDELEELKRSFHNTNQSLQNEIREQKKMFQATIESQANDINVLKLEQSKRSKTNEGSVLRCKACNHPISKSFHLFDLESTERKTFYKKTIAGRQKTLVQHFCNPHGYEFDVFTCEDSDVRCSNEAYLEYTWFKDYTWIVAHCPNRDCKTHLGWAYDLKTSTPGTDPRKHFYGLIEDKIRI